MSKSKIIIVLLTLLSAVILIFTLIFISNSKKENDRFPEEESVNSEQEVPTPTDEAIPTPTPTEAPVDKYDDPENQNYQYRDTYESNIDMSGDIDVPLSTYDWFVTPSEEEMGYNQSIYQWVAYGINQYYKGAVPGVFYFDMSEDMGESVTNMIFYVYAHNYDTELELLLDMYNTSIVVTDVTGKREVSEEPVSEEEDAEIETETEQEITPEPEGPAWMNDKIETPNEITERVKTYTTRTKINWVIKHMMEDYGYSSVEVISFERLDDMGIWAACVSFDESAVYVIREDDNSNVYCSVGE